MTEFTLVVGFLLLTILAYNAARWLYGRVHTPILLPITVSTLIIIVFLIAFSIDYETYMLGGDLVSMFLGPAVVALAYPLYNQRHLLKRLALPVIVGTFIGAIFGIVSGVLLSKWAGFSDEVIYALMPKSVTTPVAMDLTAGLGGIIPLAAVFVMIAGISGATLGPYILKYCKVNTVIGKGVAMGSGSHGVGTAKALENSELEGSFSSIAMILSAVFVSFLTPLLIPLLM